MCIFGAISPKIVRLTLNNRGKMKNLLSMPCATCFLIQSAFSGGQQMRISSRKMQCHQPNHLQEYIFMEECTLDMMSTTGDTC